MADQSLPYVRFFGRIKSAKTGKGDPSWWHLNAGAGNTRCGIKINAIIAPKDLEFSATATGDFCLRCRPIH